MIELSELFLAWTPTAGRPLRRVPAVIWTILNVFAGPPYSPEESRLGGSMGVSDTS
jgi:hypothetical protein